MDIATSSNLVTPSATLSFFMFECFAAVPIFVLWLVVFKVRLVGKEKKE